VREPVDVEARLAAEARAPVALRRVLARVAGRMLAIRGWERLGFARLEDYAAERAGVSARELRDLAAVDRALAGLPALDAAFAAGAIGWTRLRLLCASRRSACSSRPRPTSPTSSGPGEAPHARCDSSSGGGAASRRCSPTARARCLYRARARRVGSGNSCR